MPIVIVWADSIIHCADGPGSPIRRTLAAGPINLTVMRADTGTGECAS